MPEGQVSLIRNGNEWDVEWKLKITSFLEKDWAVYSSPGFSFEDKTWYMMMLLNGRPNVSDSCGCITLHLRRNSAIGPPINVEFSFAVKTLNGRKEFKRQTTRVFTGSVFEYIPVFDEGLLKFMDGFSCHEIERFFSRSDFKRRRSEFVSPSGHLTVVCTMKRLDSAGSASNVAIVDCSRLFKKAFGVQENFSHKRKCHVKCPMCSEIILLQNWDGHECQRSRSEACSYCKHNIDTENISAHEKKCMNRPIKCPECSKVVLLQNWHEHECGASEAEGVRTLRRDLKKALLSGTNHDVILKVGKKEIRAHRDILKARSRVFESMLNHDMVEKNSGVIDATDCEPEAMEQFLLYVYCGKVEKLDETIMLALYYIADKYEMEDLKEECSEFIKHSLSPSNFSKVIQLAINHSDSSLLDCATEYFTHNLLDIFRTVEWQCFLKDNSTVANELLIKSQEKEK